MKRRTLFKLLTDGLMCLLYVLLMLPLSGLVHELAGIFIGAVFILHILLNLPMFGALWRGAQKGALSAGRTALLVLDLLLPFVLAADLASGVAISSALFSFPVRSDFLYTFHDVMAWAGAALLAAHLALHAKYIAGVLRLARREKADLRTALARFGAMLGAAAVVLALVFSAAGRKISAAEGQTQLQSSASGQTSQPAQTSGKKEEETASSPAQTDVVEDAPTLSDYLSKLFCSGCGRHCPLSAPRCSRGQQKAESAQQEYYQLYGGE